MKLGRFFYWGGMLPRRHGSTELLYFSVLRCLCGNGIFFVCFVVIFFTQRAQRWIHSTRGRCNDDASSTTAWTKKNSDIIPFHHEEKIVTFTPGNLKRHFYDKPEKYHFAFGGRTKHTYRGLFRKPAGEPEKDLQLFLRVCYGHLRLLC